jgi:hypothetical protein
MGIGYPKLHTALLHSPSSRLDNSNEVTAHLLCACRPFVLKALFFRKLIGMTSFAFLRLMAFLHAGQLPLPRSLFFSDAIRARVKHSWQKMWPICSVSLLHFFYTSNQHTTNSSRRVGVVLQTDDASPLSNLHWFVILLRLLHRESLALLGLQQLGICGGRLVL